MSTFANNKYIIGIILALGYSIFVLPITEALWFNPVLGPHQIIFSYFVKAVFFLVLTAVIIFALHFFEKIRLKNKFYKSWLIHSLVYFGLIFSLLLLTWPGYWRWDELDVLFAAHNYAPFSWQSIHTQLFYIFSIYLLPFATGITIIQTTIISLIVGYILASLKRLLNRPMLAYLPGIPLVLSPVILFSNIYTLRAHLIGYLVLLLLFKALLLLKRPAIHIENRYALFIGMTLLVTIIATWRSENIFYYSFIILFFVQLGLHKNIKLYWRKTLLATGVSSIIIALFFGLGTLDRNPAYAMTSNLNTLQMMVHDELRGNSQENLNTINQVISLDILKKYPTHCDINSFWSAQLDEGRPLMNSGWDKNSKPSKYKKALIALFIDNPELFLKYKLKTYLATNYMTIETGRCDKSIGTGQFVTYNFTEKKHAFVDFFHAINKFSEPINPDFRTSVLSSLLFMGNHAARMIFWNVTPVILLCLLTLVHAIVKKRYSWVLVIAPLLIHALAVFIAAPAVIFMYYFPVYVSGFVLCMAYIAMTFDGTSQTRVKSPKNSIISTMIKSEKQKVLIAIPAYNCAPQIIRVLQEIDPKLQKRVAEIAVIDNGSTDDTIKKALVFKEKSPYKDKLRIYKNNANYNLGGTHKVAFNKALKEGFTHVVILHGDNQAKSSEVNDLLDFAENNPQQTVLGSRFNKKSRLNGYDKKRIYGNKVLNALYSILTLRRLEDLGSGINLFYLKDLDKKTYLKFADKLTFNYELILDLVKRRVDFAYLPITWSEDDQVSNARNFNIFKTALVNILRWRLSIPTDNAVRKSYGCKEVKNG